MAEPAAADLAAARTDAPTPRDEAPAPAVPDIARYLAEFIGTYLLVFTVGCNVLSGSPVWAVTSIGLVLMVSIYALGGISGANFNPAVSVALGLSNKLAWKEVGIYCIVQIVAGICASMSYGALFMKVFHLAPSEGFGWWEAGLAEFLYTFMLCFVVLNTAASTLNNPADDGNQFYGLAIGFVIIAGGYGAGSISGGAFNPAVAMGIDVSSAGLGFGWGFAYTGFELLGACAAAGMFRVVRPEDFGGSSLGQGPNYPLGIRMVSEFLGTYFLVLTVGLNVIGKSPAPVWSIAASLMCMIYALGNVSGGHFNPAVTLAIVCSGRGKCKVMDGACYIIIQVIGGICASYTYAGMHHGVTFALEPGRGFTFASAGIAELVATFTLCFVVLSVATVEHPSKDMFGLAIASCVTAGGYAIGAVSGGSLNPAVSFGISSANMINHGQFYNCLAYTLFEFMGALLAAGIFYITHNVEYAKGYQLPWSD